jgi:hypothetical protein
MDSIEGTEYYALNSKRFGRNSHGLMYSTVQAFVGRS